MELKLFLLRLGYAIDCAFNRTSMELKPRIVSLAHASNSVAFNRTSMELKLLNFHPILPIGGLSFNRTSMELKRWTRNTTQAQSINF